jgi:hypothetical protein
MKPLSEQLNELSDRAKNAENIVAAARERNRGELDRQRTALKSRIDEGKTRSEAKTAAAQDKARSWWDDTQSAVEQRFAAMRAEGEERKAERNVKKSEKRADDAEADAVYAVEFAMSMLDQAEYAIADAVIARADADELATSNPG